LPKLKIKMSKNSRRLIGLTGGIGTGKTTVARYLADNYNFPILDADRYAREAVEPGSPILTALFDRYGSRIKLPDGSLNRPALGEIIFSDRAEKTWLENQIHPEVRQRLERELASLPAQTIVLVIPLLFEAKMTDLTTEIWVVSCPEEQQIQRLIERDNLTLSQARQRLACQLPQADKIARADVVLDNSSSREFLWQQIESAIQV
jgi:dephospho-CoA kinase